jgi:hypothetical protein
METLRLGLAPVCTEYKPDFGREEENEPGEGRKEKGGRISNMQIGQIKDSSGSPGLNGTTPPSPPPPPEGRNGGRRRVRPRLRRGGRDNAWSG